MNIIKKLALTAVTAAMGVSMVSGLTAHADAATLPSITVSNGHIKVGTDRNFIPRGISLDALQYPDRLYLATGYDSPLDEVEAQMRSAKNAWNANTVRIQFEQDVLVSANGTVNTSYRDEIGQAVSYAESLGLVPVLSLQTEPSYDADNNPTSLNEPMPTNRSDNAWKALKPEINPGVMLDVFNEPRSNVSEASYHQTMQDEITSIRGSGITNVLWVQTLMWRQLHFLSSPFKGGNIVYAYHHLPAGTTATWDYDVGDWQDKGYAVVDGEWTNRTMGGAQNVGQCWTDAPTAVPAYLNYLKSRGIGVLVWTMGEDAHGNTFLNKPGGGFDSADSYDSSYSCTQPEGTEGAGQDLLAYFNYIPLPAVPKVTMKWAPYVIGQRVSVAEQKLRAAGFHTWNYNLNVPHNHEGIVTAQPNRYAKAGSWEWLHYKVRK